MRVQGHEAALAAFLEEGPTGVATRIVKYEVMEITPEQARRLLDSGILMYQNERRYLEKKAEGVPFNRIRFPQYMVKEMAVVKAHMATSDGDE